MEEEILGAVEEKEVAENSTEHMQPSKQQNAEGSERRTLKSAPKGTDMKGPSVCPGWAKILSH